MAGYLWLNKNASWLTDSYLRWSEKLLLSFLLKLQMAMYLFTAFSPGLFATGLFFAMSNSLPDTVFPYVLLLLYVGLYIVFIYLHTQQEDKKVVVWIFRVVCIINMTINPWMIAGVLYKLSSAGTFSQLIYFSGDDLTSSLLLWLVLANMLLPLLLSTLHGPFEGLHMAKSFVQFYLFLPTMIGFFNAYSFSRIWELTWGNRPSDALDSLAATGTVAQQAAKKADLKNTARFWCWLMVGLNLVVIVLLLVPWQSKSEVLLVVACVVFSAALIQMSISFLWLVSLILFRRLPELLYYAIFNRCGCRFEQRFRKRYADGVKPIGCGF